MVKIEQYLEKLANGNLDRTTSRNARRFLKEEAKRLERIRLAQLMSGLGYANDAHLRSMLDMINGDALQGMMPPLPKLWDVLNAFYHLPKETALIAPMFHPREERNHIFNSVDFFSFAADETIRAAMIEKLTEAPEGIIHHYSVANDITDVQFEKEDGQRVAFAGLSFIRWEHHIHWYIMCGPVTDLERVTNERRALLQQDAARLKATNPMLSDKHLANIMNPTAAPMKGTNNVWYCTAYGVFNLRDKKHEMRMISKEWTVSQAVFSDQFEDKFASLYETDETIRRMVDKSVVQLNEDQLFFEIAETAFMLPAYFATKITFVQTKEMQTDLGKPNNSTDRKYALKAPPEHRLLMRRVASLDFSEPQKKNYSHSYTPPRFAVNIEGYWRTLPSSSKGRDAQGVPVTGKTWVKAHTRWKDKPLKAGIVYVKTMLSKAVRTAKEKLKDGYDTINIKVE